MKKIYRPSYKCAHCGGPFGLLAIIFRERTIKCSLSKRAINVNQVETTFYDCEFVLSYCFTQGETRDKKKTIFGNKQEIIMELAAARSGGKDD